MIIGWRKREREINLRAVTNVSVCFSNTLFRSSMAVVGKEAAFQLTALSSIKMLTGIRE